MKVEERPQLWIVVSVDAVVVAVVVVALEEERMVYLDQQHFGRKEQADVVVVEG